jgi:hypothetical protein
MVVGKCDVINRSEHGPIPLPNTTLRVVQDSPPLFFVWGSGGMFLLTRRTSASWMMRSWAKLGASLGVLKMDPRVREDDGWERYAQVLASPCRFSLLCVGPR